MKSTMLFRTLLLPAALNFCLLISCEKPDPDEHCGDETGYAEGIFITNEGAFGNSNGSITYFSKDSMKVVNHLFQMVNGRPLGDVVFSFSKTKEKGYIVVNNSGKIEIVDLKTFKSLGYITGLTYPRYLFIYDDHKAYLSDGNMQGNILVMNLLTNTIVDSVKVGTGPENMIANRDQLVVANSGGWGNDSTLSVINTVTDQVIATWLTGYNPVEMVMDKHNVMWVLCKGKTVWNGDWTIALETPSEVVAMDPGSGEILKRISIGTVGDFFWPEHISISRDKSTVYYLENDAVYTIQVADNEPVQQAIIERSFYGFEVDFNNGDLYGLSAPSFTAAGWLVRYTSSGALIDSLKVGIGPNQVIFH